MRKYVIIFIIAFLLISPVAAGPHFRVSQKRIEGNGGQPGYICIVGNEWEEYPVSQQDYNQINVGNEIRLEYDESMHHWVIK